MAPYSVRHVTEIPLVATSEEGDPDWHPVQHHLGLAAYGANVYVAHERGVELIGEHDETGSGQEELYFVASGRARFTLDGAEFDVREGTFVAVPDPKVRRAAVADAPGTSVLAVGGRAAGEFVSTWNERHFEGVPQL